MAKKADNIQKSKNKRPWKVPTWLLVVTFPLLYFSGFIIVFSPIWFAIQAKRLNNLGTTRKISKTVLLTNIISFLVMYLAFAFFDKEMNSGGDFFLVPFAFAFLITYVILLFRICDMLADYSEREGKDIKVSGIGTWFLGMYYLQYKINKIF